MLIQQIIPVLDVLTSNSIPEVRRCGVAARNFVESMTGYVGSKQKELGEEIMRQKFLDKGTEYQNAMKVVREIVPKEEDSPVLESDQIQIPVVYDTLKVIIPEVELPE